MEAAASTMSFDLPPEQIGPAAWYGPEMAKRSDWLMPLSAAEIGEIEGAIRMLVDRGADPNVADKEGNTPLHAASQAGDVDFLTKLLAKRANPNARTAKAPARSGAGGGGFFRIVGEQTPLMLAARANQLAAMRTLIAEGADPKLKAQDGSTLLMAAAGRRIRNVQPSALALLRHTISPSCAWMIP